MICAGWPKSIWAITFDSSTPVRSTEPANRLALPRLISFPYRLYPVVDQIADKVCATVATYNGRPSSREKDLVDLVVLATTQEVSGRALHAAIIHEARLRQMEPISRFTVPTTWGIAYVKMAKSVPYCSSYMSVEAARDLVASFIDPVLSGSASDSIWLPATLGWHHDSPPVPNTGDVQR